MSKRNPPLVSVIIPSAQRGAPAVLRAISSVLGQTYPSLEIILVDDNTKAGLSSEIKAAVKNIPQVKYIKNIGSHGACTARNVGIACAEGETIAFLDDDDEWLPEKIERQMRALTKDVVLVYCNGWRIDNRCDPPLVVPYRRKEDFFQSVSFGPLLEKNHIGTTSQLLVRKSALEQIDGFDARFPARQDYDLCLRLTQIGQAVGVDAFLFRHYLHDEDQISKSSRASLNGYLMLLEKYQQELRCSPHALCSLYFKIARMHRLQQHTTKAIYYYCRGALLEPVRWQEGLRKLNDKKPV